VKRKIRSIVCLLPGFFFLAWPDSGPAQHISSVDSAKNVSIQSNLTDAEFIKTCFFITDNYMDVEQYDSAQLWLNKIHAKLPAKTNSLSNYFLITRQAEVYYYNNLQQIGLQESLRGLDMAKALADSLLLADSYNFLGLFYMNIDSVAKSVGFYKEGIKYTRQPPYPKIYLSLTKPHHLYGNLSEAYYKLGQFDLALAYNRISLQKANAIQWQRGIAVAHKSMGDIFIALLEIDSAAHYFINGVKIAQAANEIDVQLLCYCGLAKCYLEQKKYPEAKTALQDGVALLKENPTINRFFALQFLKQAIEIYKKTNENEMLISALEQKSAMETSNIKGNNTQIQTILNAGVANEKRILSLEVAEAKQRQQLATSRLGIALIAFSLLGITFFVYRYYQNQKFAISRIRHKISQDLHDDIGASLSSLQIYGAVAEKTFKNNPEKAMEMLQKISVQSKTVMENMNDIVWSMNTNNTGTLSLETKIKNYGAELLSENAISFNCMIDAAVEPMLTQMTAKRNILLIIREAMNNIAKYSKASVADLQVQVKDKNLEIAISDNGTGFDTEHRKNGNGIENMKKRTEELKGLFTFQSIRNRGTFINILIPLKSL
jgi:signal transduction histidine kinase